MPSRLHERVGFCWYRRNRAGRVAGTVGENDDLVLAYIVPRTKARHLFRLRKRGNVTKLTRPELLTCCLDQRYLPWLLALCTAERDHLENQIRWHERQIVRTMEEAERVPSGGDWVEEAIQGSAKCRSRRLAHHEIEGQAHYDDSDVDFTVFTEWTWTDGDGQENSATSMVRWFKVDRLREWLVADRRDLRMIERLLATKLR